MRARAGRRLVIAVVLALAAPAGAQTFDFATCDPAVTAATACSSTITRCCKQAAAAGSSFLFNGVDKAIVIPMDACHQDGSASGSSNGPRWCSNKPSGSGLMLAYGLVYRLLQN